MKEKMSRQMGNLTGFEEIIVWREMKWYSDKK